jgi:hypothetical protein
VVAGDGGESVVLRVRVWWLHGGESGEGGDGGGGSVGDVDGFSGLTAWSPRRPGGDKAAEATSPSRNKVLQALLRCVEVRSNRVVGLWRTSFVSFQAWIEVWIPVVSVRVWVPAVIFIAVESLFSLDRSGDGFAVGGDNISGNVVWSVFSFRSFAKGWKAFCFPSPALLVMVDFLSGMAASSSRGEISGHLLVMGVSSVLVVCLFIPPVFSRWPGWCLRRDDPIGCCNNALMARTKREGVAGNCSWRWPAARRCDIGTAREEDGLSCNFLFFEGCSVKFPRGVPVKGVGCTV